MKEHTRNDNISLYTLEKEGPEMVERYIASTAETRAICSDPFVYGVEYTDKLRDAGTHVLNALQLNNEPNITELNTVVLHILRGGLNYGLRESLHAAYGWNTHSSAYISSQRAKDADGDWYITENRYQKVYLPDNAHIILGDVVATGSSLEHALMLIIDIAAQENKTISGFTFFTIGGDRSEAILQEVDAKCRQLFGDAYQGSRVIYYEGVFGVAEEGSTLSIALSGTDLLHSPAVMAPEFIESQKDELPYAIERCTIYDAGSRAFHLEEYLEDVRDYWQQVLKLAEGGMTLSAYLKERFPEDSRVSDADWMKEHDTQDSLAAVAKEQIEKTHLG